MIAHERQRVHPAAPTLGGVGDEVQQAPVIKRVGGDDSAVVASVDDVVGQPGNDEAMATGHGRQLSAAPWKRCLPWTARVVMP